MKLSKSVATLVLTAFVTTTPAFAIKLQQFEFPELKVSGEVNTERITVYFNPKEYTITKSTPWKHHDIQGLDAPTLEFTTGEPYRCQFELFFDRYEEGKSVREITDRIEKLALSHGEAQQVIVNWNKETWVTTLLEAKTRFVDFLPDGTPVAAVMGLLWSDFVPAEKLINPPYLAPATLLLPGGVKVATQVNADAIELLHLNDPPLLVGGLELKLQSAIGLTPRVSFTAGEPYRLRMEWTLEAEPGRPLQELVARLEKLAQAGSTIEILIGDTRFKGVLESFGLRFTLFLDDGTPVRAVMSARFKEFSPAEEQLKGNPRH